MPKRRQSILFDDQSRYLDRFGLVLFLTILAIAALALIDLSAPTGDLAAGLASIATSMLVGVTLLLAMRASGMRLKWRRVADVLVVIVLAFIVSGVVYGLVADAELFTRQATRPVTLLVLAALAPLVVVRRLLQHRTVTRGTLFGAISAFLLLPIAFYYAFLTIDGMQGSAFFGSVQPTTSFMYFSLSTITTVGYGDLTAVTPFARLVATAEAVSGQVYLVTFVAMLVGLRAQHWASGRKNDDADEDTNGAAADA
ncbi:MAG: ion channel [Gammaproteobacteria bacterium]|jgi:hypothetical protein|nr:ion channel [Gammaproteobacteria bacterium]